MKCGTGRAAELAAKAEAERLAKEKLAKAEAEARECEDLVFYNYDEKGRSARNQDPFAGQAYYILKKYKRNPDVGLRYLQTNGRKQYGQFGTNASDKSFLEYWYRIKFN
jgi:hypothetical protein